MKKNETDALNEMLIVLENKRKMELRLLKEQFQITFESLKPINLIKSGIQEVTTTPELKNNIVDNAIGLGIGLLSKKLWIGHSTHPIKSLFGNMIQFAVANVVSKHAVGIKSKGANLLHGLLKFRNQLK